MLMLIILPTGHNNYNCHYVKVVSSKTVQTDTTAIVVMRLFTAQITAQVKNQKQTN